MSTERRSEKQASDAPARRYFDPEHPGAWKETAEDLIRGVFYNFEPDDPEPLVKIFAALEAMATDTNTRDALDFLIEASFNGSRQHSEACVRFKADCLNKPSAWELAEANPRRTVNISGEVE